MSTIIEDPAIPLVGLNGRNKMYSDSSASEIDLQSCRRFATVGSRLAKRKELFTRRKRTCDVALVLAMLGIVLMIVDTEFIAAGKYGRNSIPSGLVKMCITASTVALLIFQGLYQKLDIELFIIDNGVDDWRLAMSSERVIRTSVEFLVCIIHPIPGDFNFHWEATMAEGQMRRNVEVPLDAILSLPMFLRFYLICRAVMLHSRLYQDASSQGLGALNRIHFNFRFIFKSLMTLYPEYVLAIIMVGVLLLASWALRLCEMYDDVVHANLLNCMWLVAVTFLSVGYGDIVPNSYCGRGIAVLTGIMGAGCTALVVAVLAKRLELSRAEKYVHDFVIDADLGKRLKHEAANVMRAGWFLYKYKRNKDKTSLLLWQHRKLLKAVYNIRQIKAAQRRLMDASVTLVEMGKGQVEMSTAIDLMRWRQITLDEKVESMENKICQIYEKVVSINKSLQEGSASSKARE